MKRCQHIKKMLMASLLTTLPLGAVNSAPVTFESMGHDLNLSIDAETIDEVGTLQIDAEGGVRVNMPFGLSTKMQYRIDETIDSLGDVTIDEDYFWKTVEELSLSKKIFVTIEVGKIKDIGFGALSSGVGSSVLPRAYDDALVMSQLELRGKTGIKISALNDLLPGEKAAVQMLRKALEGVTVSFFDANSKTKPSFDSFEDLSGYAAQKVGQIMGVNYQLSYINNDNDSGKDRRWNLSADTCIQMICIGAEHMDLTDTEMSPYESQSRASIGTKVTPNTNIAVQYQRNKAKEGQDENPNARGDVTSALVEHQLTARSTVGASVGYDKKKEEAVYNLNYNYSFDKRTKKTDAGLFRNLKK